MTNAIVKAFVGRNKGSHSRKVTAKKGARATLQSRRRRQKGLVQSGFGGGAPCLGAHLPPSWLVATPTSLSERPKGAMKKAQRRRAQQKGWREGRKLNRYKLKFSLSLRHLLFMEVKGRKGAPE
ncbi:MAG: hypothetical protein KEFWMYNX_000748 [Candidatus Fervidibacter sp.]|jgi:hypothetical protein